MSSKTKESAISPQKQYEAVLKDVATDFSDSASVNYVALKAKYLGRAGCITQLLRNVGSIEEKDRAAYGKQVHDLRAAIERRLERVKDTQKRMMQGASLIESDFDVTAPYGPNTPQELKGNAIAEKGTVHPLTSVGEKAVRIFETMGFHVTESRRLDSDYHVFESLNIPQGHPARDMWDTFWTNSGLIPITHTSAMQNRILSSGQPPQREIIVGKCFRHEATDASHEHTFYQLEGVYVDKGVTLTDLIGVLSSFMNAFYGQKIKYKMQPSYFPFVEPR